MGKGAMPVIVGAGQTVSHWDGTGGAEAAPSSVTLAAEASRRALADADVSANEIQWLGVIRTNEDSIPTPPPFGENKNVPGSIAREIGAKPAHTIYSGVGGQSPQQYVNEAAALIHAGEADCALVTGGESIGAAKTARRAGITLDWADDADLPFENRVDPDRLLTRLEIKHGLVFPPTFYGLFENAIAAREGRTRTQHRQAMSRLWETFSAVAADNPNAQFPDAKSAEFLATPSKENFEVSDPFLKWHVAQDAVNLGAAVLIMSEEKADALGVPGDKRVYLHGAGEAADTMISERADMDRSWAMDAALSRALGQAGKTAGDIALFDLYSCFPCAVFSSAAILEIDPDTETRPLTLTGGLPFFGGPGNNYSLHGVAEMVSQLRGRPGEFGLVLANGGWMSKEAAGVYSTARPESFTPAEAPAKNAPQTPIADSAEAGTLETFTIFKGRDGGWTGIGFIRTGDGARALANSTPDALKILQEDASPIGRPVTIEAGEETNLFSFA